MLRSRNAVDESSDVRAASEQPGSQRFLHIFFTSEVEGDSGIGYRFNAKVIDIQAQSLEAELNSNGVAANWDTFVSNAIAQARQANPGITVLVGLTNAYTSNATLLDSDLQYAINHGANGAWINEDPGFSTSLMDEVVHHFIG